jgi:hypothetical protein
MSQLTANIDIGSKAVREQMEYIGQLENSVTEFCVQSTGKQGVVSRVTEDFV